MTFTQFSGIVELRTKIVSLSTYIISLLYSIYVAGTVSPLLAVLVLTAALAVDMGTTGFNSYFDWYRNVDDPRFNRESAKVIIHEGVSPGSALLVSILCYVVACMLGGIIILMTGPLVLILGSLSLLVGFFYSGGSRPISSTPWGELFAGGFLGFVFFIINYYILTGRLDQPALLVAIPQSLAIAAILSVNNACDMVGDRAAGRRTMAIVLGVKGAQLLVYIEGLVGLLMLAFLAYRNILPQLSLYLTLPALILILTEYAKMHQRGYSHDTKGPNMQSISKIFILQSLVYIGGLLEAILFV
ncbi:prenyltransferase [Gracilinema caldarium]|uniref:UbiA prenyltransferase n=1 Tax=Gracilinema caldarium (strain ATCC 51460 / DSM 7334 / H1) TaxID=744872 RepID=F8F060_GRAC1|nr:prenyltransferase [Gracilinema caldarium]AEJ18713.1 UbiA prenyltransferase [Gracilinema caldarium DSM 7334]